MTECFPVCCHEASEPHAQTVGQTALQATAVEGHQQVLDHVVVSEKTREMQSLLRSLDNYDGRPPELEIRDPLHFAFASELLFPLSWCC